MQKTIKVEFEGELRRFSTKNETNFSKLKEEISQLIKVPSEQLNIKYTDDEEDLVTLSSQEELKEALKCSPNNTLRLQISRKQKQRQPQPKLGGQPQRVVPINVAYFPRNKQNMRQCFQPQFSGYICDGCEVDIKGERFHCGDCPDFDFCGACFSSKENQNKHFQGKHNFSKFNQFNPLSLKRNISFAPKKQEEKKEKQQIQQNLQRRGICCKPMKATVIHKNEHKVETISHPRDLNHFKNLLQHQKHQQKNKETQKNKFIAVPLVKILPKKEQKVQFESKEEKKQESKVQVKKQESKVQVKKQESKVQVKKQESKVQVKKQQKRRENPFIAKLKILEEMGFTEKEKNISLLVKHKGKVIEVIREFLN